MILGLGRLALNLVEIQHLREAWIDWERGEIHIPEHDPCACHRCCILAERKWLQRGFRDLQQNGVFDENTSFTEADKGELRERLDPSNLENILYSTQFEPRNGQARTVSFGWSKRITGVFMNFFDNIGPYLDMKQAEINNLITEAATNSEDLDRADIGANILTNTGMYFMAQVCPTPKIFHDVTGYKHLHSAQDKLKELGGHDITSGYSILVASQNRLDFTSSSINRDGAMDLLVS